MDFENYHVSTKMYQIPMDEVSPVELIDFFKKISNKFSASLEIWDDKYCIFI